MKRPLIALLGAIAVLLALGSGAAQAQSVQGVEQVAGTGQSAESSASSTQTNPSNSNVSVRIFSPGDSGNVSQSNNSAAASAAANAASTAQAVSQSQGGGGGGEQAVGQAAGTVQHADSEAVSKQIKPSNSNISVRIHSPGDDGDVEQSNNSVAGSFAGNKAETTQAVKQDQGGGDSAKSKCCGGGSGVQAVGQKALTLQKADSEAKSIQAHPSNENISVRIGSKGDNGSVDQSNNSAALSFAGNKAETTQAVKQDQGGGDSAKSKCCHGGAGVQAVGQEALTLQKADSDATSYQDHASNKNIPVRIGSEGDNGSVSQSNNSAALSFAGNAASTGQFVHQSQGGGCGCSSDLVQAVGQKAITGQFADSEATSIQKGAKNSNTPVRIHSKGDDGDVDQSNNSIALSAALNAAKTAQVVDQSQSGDCRCEDGKDHGKSYGKDDKYDGGKDDKYDGGKDDKYDGGKDDKYDDGHKSDGARVQAVGQWAETFQKANSDATSVQWKPTNTNAPVREKSWGGGGSVSQSNNSLAASAALNLARTFQFVRQNQ